MNHKPDIMSMESPPLIILFDDACGFCQGWIRRVAAHDPHRRFRFAGLSTAAGRMFLQQCSETVIDEGDTVILVENGTCHQRSTAGLRIARRMSGAWPLLYALILVPRPLRDLVYDLIARRRHKICPLPDPHFARDEAVRKRLLA